MDTKEMKQAKETTGEEKEEVKEEVREEVKKEEKKGKGKKAVLIGGALLAVVLIAIAVTVWGIMRNLPEKGYENYTMRFTQDVVEYSEKYDYWDVLTIEYPQIEGVEGEQIEKLNKIIYDTAMDRTNYWHLEPNDQVRKFQDEYTMFCSDVKSYVTYHSQYLVSIDYFELYAPDHPVYYLNFSERGVNMDLVTGEVYGLSDIFKIDDTFIKVWCSAAHEEYGDSIPDDEETYEIMRTWFLGEDEELNELYEIRPFFSITEEKDFEIGISIEPKLEGLRGSRPSMNIYSAVIPVKELEACRNESEFWNKYEKSESAGEVIQCEELKENIWLGEDAGVWSYWEER